MTFAFAMDRMKQERERGLSISLKKRDFYTDRFRYTLLDVPGHRDFLKSMLRGLSQADVGVLMVPADQYMAFALNRGNRMTGETQGQARQHARLLNVLGIKQLIVCVTKMDSSLAAFSQERFEEAAEATKQMLVQTGWKKDFVEAEVPMIPISGWTGDNLLHASAQMPWWTGAIVGASGQRRTILTLAAALNDASLPERPTAAPLRVPVTGNFKIKGIGDVFTGRIAQGAPKPGDEVAFLPAHTASNPCTGRIYSCEMHHRQLENPAAGDIVGFNVKGMSRNNMPYAGCVMVPLTSAVGAVTAFSAQVMVLAASTELRVGYEPKCFVHSLKTSVRLDRIVWKQGTSGKEENPQSLRANEMAEVVFRCTRGGIALETLKVCETMGRLVFVEGYDEVMVGKVLQVDRK